MIWVELVFNNVIFISIKLKQMRHNYGCESLTYSGSPSSYHWKMLDLEIAKLNVSIGSNYEKKIISVPGPLV